jgi:SNF2 family DNA or RNA helicase
MPMQYEFHSEPFDYQRRIFQESATLEAHGLLWEQGCGKTKQGIDIACHLYEEGKINAALIVAPPGVHRNWLTDELPKHVPIRLRDKIKAEVWESATAKNKGTIVKMKNLLSHQGFSWLFVSYDGFMTDAGKKYMGKFLGERKCLYMLDEAHNIKSPAAKRTKTIVASGKYAPYRRILTGTPISKGPFDIYSQLKFLEENFWKKYGFSNFQVFKFHFGEWFTRSDSIRTTGRDPGFDKLLGYKNMDQLQKIVETICSRVTKETAGLNLPPKLYSRRLVELTATQKRLYNELKNNKVAVLDSFQVPTIEGDPCVSEIIRRQIDGTLALTLLLRCQQIICGYVQTDDNGPLHVLEGKNPRLEALAELVDGIFHPAIIWARFTKDIDQIMDLLGDNAVRYDGKVSAEQAAENKRRFQEGEVQFFVATPQKGSSGLTLVRAKTVIFYSNSFDLVHRLQAEDRAHRIGQDVPVSYIDIVCKGTVDEHIVKSLREKFDIASQITGDKLKEWI